MTRRSNANSSEMSFLLFCNITFFGTPTVGHGFVRRGALLNHSQLIFFVGGMNLLKVKSLRK